MHLYNKLNKNVLQISTGRTANSNNKPWAYICPKGFCGGLILGEAYFQKSLLSDRVLHFKMGWACQ